MKYLLISLLLAFTILRVDGVGRSYVRGTEDLRMKEFPTYEISEEGSRLYEAFLSGNVERVKSIIDKLEAEEKEWEKDQPSIEEREKIRKEKEDLRKEQGEEDAVEKPQYGPLGRVINSIISQDREIPLHLSARLMPELFERIWDLTEGRAARTFANHDGQTASLIACKAGNLGPVKHVYSFHENYRRTDVDRNTCIHLAAQGGHVDVVDFLLDNTAGLLHWGNVDKYTPLGLSLINGHDEVALLLLKRGSPLIYELQEIRDKVKALIERHPKIREEL